VTPIFRNANGPLPRTSESFATMGGPLLITVSGTAFGNVVESLGIDVAVDANLLGSVNVYAGEIASHKTFPSVTFYVVGIPAGLSHTIVLTAQAGTQTDINDYYDVIVEELN
jgi:hypothetical protein